MEVTRECKLKDLFKRGLISDFAWLNFLTCIYLIALLIE